MHPRQPTIESFKVVLAYLTLALAWIVFSDWVLEHLIADPSLIARLQTAKGMLFVLVTAALLHYLILRMYDNLRRYDQLYQSIFLANPFPMWIYELDSRRFLLVNDAAVSRYGYSTNDFLGMTIDEIRPPEDLPALLEQLKKHAVGLDSQTSPWRHRDKQGKLFWVEVESHPIDYLGKAARLVAVREITRFLEAQEVLRLHAEVFDNSLQGIMITDAANHIISVNRAFENITGYQRAEVLGNNPSFLASGRQGDDFYEDMWHGIRQEGHWQGEVWNRRKNGEIYPEWLTISTIRDQDGRVERHIGIFSDISSEKDAEARINFLAHYDPLTNLPNRSLLRERLQFAIANAGQANDHICLMLLDIDRFKHVNEAFGMETGDRLLILLARRMMPLLTERDTLSRQGGDEFVLLLPGRDPQQAGHLARQILQAITRPFNLSKPLEQEISLTASIGVALFPDNGRDAGRLLQCADSALFQAKELGRNRFHFFSEDNQQQSLEFIRIETGLRRAIAQQELTLFYQPQYDTLNEKLVGAEALIRWQHPEWGMVAPGQFIPVAEETGQIIQLGRWVLETAVAQLAEWSRQGLPLVPVAVNLSVSQLRSGELAAHISDLLTRHGVEPHLLHLEITESVAMEGSVNTSRIIDELNGLGVSIAIDDFGSGYSSLSYLKQLRIQKLKIDQSFIQDIGRDPSDEAIVNAIIALARTLGLNTIAEGVETAEQLAFLKAAGCDEIQGFLFSKPLPTAEFESCMKKEKMMQVVDHGHDPH